MNFLAMKHRKFFLRLKDRFFPHHYGDVYGHGFWADVLGKHRIQSAPHPDGGWDWSCSCGEKDHSGDQRDHWADVGIRALNRRGGSVQFTPEVERWRRKVILVVLDREIKRGKQ